MLESTLPQMNDVCLSRILFRGSSIALHSLVVLRLFKESVTSSSIQLCYQKTVQSLSWTLVIGRFDDSKSNTYTDNPERRKPESCKDRIIWDEFQSGYQLLTRRLFQNVFWTCESPSANARNHCKQCQCVWQCSKCSQVPSVGFENSQRCFIDVQSFSFGWEFQFI